ncbi:14371_t:CDS:2, partial [Acaulospora colombiana]
MDKKANENLFETKTALYGSEVAVQMMDTKLGSFRLEIPSAVSCHSTTISTEHDSEIEKISNEMLSTHDEDVNNPEIDSIVVDKISDLILSNLNLEEIWDKVMERLKQENLRVQSIESQIVDLSNWKKVDWSRILKTPDYAQLFNRSKKKLCKDSIDKEVQDLLHDGCGQIRSLNDLKLWKSKFSVLKSEDSQLAVGVIEFLEINILVMQHRERDYIVKILSPIIGFIFEEFDIGTFELNWVEKDSRSVTHGKRKFVHEEYMELEPPSKKMDLIISLRSYKVELLVLEAGNTEGPMDDTKFRQDHSKIKIVMKDCLDSFRYKLHLKKSELEEVFVMSIQITDGDVDVANNLSEMEDLLPGFLRNLLALR